MKKKPYACEICGATWEVRSKLEIHMRSHSGDKPYSCDICSRRFNVLSNLRRHLKTVHSIERASVSHISASNAGVSASLSSPPESSSYAIDPEDYYYKESKYTTEQQQHQQQQQQQQQHQQRQHHQQQQNYSESPVAYSIISPAESAPGSLNSEDVTGLSLSSLSSNASSAFYSYPSPTAAAAASASAFPIMPVAQTQLPFYYFSSQWQQPPLHQPQNYGYYPPASPSVIVPSTLQPQTTEMVYSSSMVSEPTLVPSSSTSTTTTTTMPSVPSYPMVPVPLTSSSSIDHAYAQSPFMLIGNPSIYNYYPAAMVPHSSHNTLVHPLPLPTQSTSSSSTSSASTTSNLDYSNGVVIDSASLDSSSGTAVPTSHVVYHPLPLQYTQRN